MWGGGGGGGAKNSDRMKLMRRNFTGTDAKFN